MRTRLQLILRNSERRGLRQRLTKAAPFVVLNLYLLPLTSLESFRHLGAVAAALLRLVEREVCARDHVVARLVAPQRRDADREREREGAASVAEEPGRDGESYLLRERERAGRVRLGREHEELL